VHKNRCLSKSVCNSVKFEIGQNLLLVLKIVTHTACTCCYTFVQVFYF